MKKWEVNVLFSLSSSLIDNCRYLRRVFKYCKHFHFSLTVNKIIDTLQRVGVWYSEGVKAFVFYSNLKTAILIWEQYHGTGLLHGAGSVTLAFSCLFMCSRSTSRRSSHSALGLLADSKRSFFQLDCMMCSLDSSEMFTTYILIFRWSFHYLLFQRLILYLEGIHLRFPIFQRRSLGLEVSDMKSLLPWSRTLFLLDGPI